MSIAESLTAFIDRFYVSPLPRIVSRRIFRYGVCGGANMVLDLVWYWFVYHFVVAKRFVDLGFVVVSPHVSSLAIVFPITFFTGFWLNRNVAFCATRMNSGAQMLRYAATVAVSLLLNYLCIKFFVEVCGVWATPAKALTTVISVVYSYLAGRYFTFAR